MTLQIRKEGTVDSVRVGEQNTGEDGARVVLSYLVDAEVPNAEGTETVEFFVPAPAEIAIGDPVSIEITIGA